MGSFRVATSVHSEKEFLIGWNFTMASIFITGIISGTSAMLGFIFRRWLEKKFKL